MVGAWIELRYRLVGMHILLTGVKKGWIPSINQSLTNNYPPIPPISLSLRPNTLIMIQPALLGVLGTNEIIIILVIVLLLFGGKKIPELMRGLGKGVREFNDAKQNVKKEIEESTSDIKNAPNN